ncbi:hypothetical protein D3Y57_10960 [Sphingomonas paeninsulae]|uniref:Uncharacterized protein n=2 Tax=Sphingomonas paeninsulae TaxID=2319844 RepID=A0A494TAM2_SPHPE|nr:hypothetical protein D3Y57_10960 [Sphingomonas paeninsulae]
MILKRLALLLESPFLPVQEVIAREVGCDQPFVSRAANRRLIRITDRVTHLRRYAVMRVRAERVAHHASEAGDRWRGAKDANKASTSDPRARSTIEERADQEVVGDYASEAVNGIHMYLADGYDARLIVEQIAVLRRAQQIRRPGSPHSSLGRTTMDLSR